MDSTENKYYTPEIEEFCVGFEYEFMSDEPSGYHSRHDCPDWTKREFYGSSGAEDEDSELDCIRKAIENKGDYFHYCRVKLFDRADIASCGFEFVGHYDDNCPEFSKDIVRIRMWENNVLTINRLGAETFCGTIKNITEFRKLLKQLGI